MKSDPIADSQDYSVLLKDMTILTGTMFTTSIALAAGRDTNTYFVFGELFLFISLVSGLGMLWHELMRQKKRTSGFLYKFTSIEVLPLGFFIPMVIGMVLIWYSLMK